MKKWIVTTVYDARWKKYDGPLALVVAPPMVQLFLTKRGAKRYAKFMSNMPIGKIATFEVSKEDA